MAGSFDSASSAVWLRDSVSIRFLSQEFEGRIDVTSGSDHRTDVDCADWFHSFDEFGVSYLVLSRPGDSGLLQKCRDLKEWLIDYDDGSTVVLRKLVSEPTEVQTN